MCRSRGRKEVTEEFGDFANREAGETTVLAVAWIGPWNVDGGADPGA